MGRGEAIGNRRSVGCSPGRFTFACSSCWLSLLPYERRWLEASQKEFFRQIRFPFLTLLFIAAVLCAEGIILWKAAHQYYLKPIEYKDRWDFAGLAPSKASVRTTWAGLGLFLFALPFAFWETRLEPDTVLATLVGCAVNLLFVSTIIHTLVSFKRHARMASQRRTEQPTS